MVVEPVLHALEVMLSVSDLLNVLFYSERLTSSIVFRLTASAHSSIPLALWSSFSVGSSMGHLSCQSR